MLVMDFTEQLSSSHFLEAIKIDDKKKKKAGGFAAGKTCKIIACAFSVTMIMYNHKPFDWLQKYVKCYFFLT